MYFFLLPESNAVYNSGSADCAGDFPAETLREAAL